jgi:hypothetical protein
VQVIHRTALAFCSLLLAVAGVQAQASAAAAPVSSAPAAPEQRAGTIKSVRGDVRLQSRDATDAHAASAGEAVQPIDRILTGADSGASLVMRDGTAIVVGPSSRLDVKDFRFDSTTEDGGLVVALLRGSLRMATGLIGKTHPEAVHVETPTAVIGIRGTDFIVETDNP